MARVIFSGGLDAHRGEGLAPKPGEGLLGSDLVSAEGACDGDVAFAPGVAEQDPSPEVLPDVDGPVGEADEAPAGDRRVQSLDVRANTLRADLPVQPIVVNEVLGSTTGDDAEYVELFGPAGVSLGGLSVIVVEGEDAGQIGDVSFRVDLDADDALGDDGFFLLANGTTQQTYGVTADVTIGENAIENGAYTAALVETASLSGDAVTGGEIVLDAVAVVGTAPATTFFDAPVLGPDGTFLPAGVGRVEDGVDTDQASDFRILSFFNDPAINTPIAGAGDDDGGGGGGGGSIDDAPTPISAVQGEGDESPIVGSTVVVEGVVVGDFQTGDADATRDLGGFFVMEETVDRDGSEATSEGVFAFEGGATGTDVGEGDTVRVLGTVVERFGKTTIQVDQIRIESAGTTADALALAVSTSLPATEDREALEAVLVTFDEPLTFVESFDYEQFNAGTLAAGGSIFQFTQNNDPNVAGNEAFREAVEDRTILIEDGLDGRRDDGDPILQPDGEPFAVDQGIRMGQELRDQTAIVDFAFGDYRLRLPGSAEFEPVRETNPRPLEPEDVGSDYKVAAFNVLNYFTTLDDGSTTDIGAGPRGAESEEELARQTVKLVAGITALDADVVGLIEIENDFAGDEFALATLTDALNAEAGSARWAFVDPGTEFVGADAISNAFLYDRTTTALVGDAFVLDSDAFTAPLTPGDPQNRPAIFQTFREIASGEAFTAVVNHYKSKGSLTGAPADQDQGDGAGRNDATREAASRALLEVIATDPTGSGDPDFVILGDLNAYGREDPITVLEEGGFTDLAERFEGEATHSFRFSGQIGTLDYALANASLNDQVTGATIWNVNSDEMFVFDYNLESTFGAPILRPRDQGLFEGDEPAKSSDHDAVIVGLDLGAEAPTVIAGTAGTDRLVGTSAAEVFEASGGFDVVSGGGGGDVFVFTDVEGARDTLRIRDFDVDEDAIDLGGAVVESALSIGSTLRIRLEGADRDALLVSGADDLDAITFVDDAPLV